MARLGGKDRGLEPKPDQKGKPIAWRVRIADITGKIIRGRWWPTKEEAKHDLITMRAKFRDGAHHQTRNWTVAEEITQYEQVLLAGNLRTRKDQLIFARWWKAYGRKIPLDRLTPAHIEKARELLRHGYKPGPDDQMVKVDGIQLTHARVNRYTDWLRHVLNIARRQKRLTKENPVSLIERHSETRSTPYPYSAEERSRILAELGEQADWLRLALLTNMRRGNQFSLRKDQIRFDLGIILLGQTKNGKPRIVTLSKLAHEILQRWCAKTSADYPYVFPATRRRGQNGTINPVNPNWWYRRIFKPACIRAGIPIERISGGLWHAARDTFGSTMAQLGYQEHMIMRAGGWTDAEAVLHYIQIADPHVREAMEKVAGELGGTVTKLSPTQLSVNETEKT